MKSHSVVTVTLTELLITNDSKHYKHGNHHGIHDNDAYKMMTGVNVPMVYQLCFGQFCNQFCAIITAT